MKAAACLLVMPAHSALQHADISTQQFLTICKRPDYPSVLCCCLTATAVVGLSTTLETPDVTEKCRTAAFEQLINCYTDSDKMSSLAIMTGCCSKACATALEEVSWIPGVLRLALLQPGIGVAA